MTDRPYRDYSQAELIEIRRNLQKASRAADRERQEFLRKFAGKRDDSWILADDDYRAIGNQIERCREDLVKVEAEFRARRDAKAARRSVRERRPGSNNGIQIETLACSCRPARRIYVTQEVHQTGHVICGLCHQSFE
jgi:hypothetical protein